ncbi:hypothetical protein IU463_29770, partial [Nocardia farcinica]|nr:hypothetical protein [Nocardia farcinica]
MKDKIPGMTQGGYNQQEHRGGGGVGGMTQGGYNQQEQRGGGGLGGMTGGAQGERKEGFVDKIKGKIPG